MPEWLDLIQIFWMLAACYFCYLAGKNGGIRDTIHILMDNGIVTKEDLKKLDDKLQKEDVD
jgi:hypothetical protein